MGGVCISQFLTWRRKFRKNSASLATQDINRRRKEGSRRAINTTRNLQNEEKLTYPPGKSDHSCRESWMMVRAE